MKTSIIYFSRTGKTKDVATELASMIDAKIYEITDDKSWKGVFGYIKGGFYASTNKHVNITFDKKCLEAEQYIVMSPLWAGGAAPAIRVFLNNYDNKKISLLLTNDGSDINKAFENVKNQHSDIKKFYGITKKLNNKSETLNKLKNDFN